MLINLCFFLMAIASQYHCTESGNKVLDMFLSNTDKRLKIKNQIIKV